MTTTWGRGLVPSSLEQNDKRLDFLLGKTNTMFKAAESTEASGGWIATSKNDAECNDCPLDDPEDSGGSDFDFDKDEEVTEAEESAAWKGREAAEEAA